MIRKDKLLILGASGHGKVAADVAMKMKKWLDISFLDDNDQIKSVVSLDVIGNFDDAKKHIEEYDMFVALGNNQARKKVLTELEIRGASIATLIHPNTVIGLEADISAGSIIMPGVIINSCSKVGLGCIINTGATIDHDNVIENYVHISPGVHLAGTIHICEGTWVGIGGIVINNITVCGGSVTQPVIIGAGAVVIEDISAPGVYAGVPARRIKR